MALAVKVVTGEAILAHPYIFNPRSESAEIDPGKYTGMVIIKKSDKETVTKLKSAVDSAIKSQWPDKAPGGLSMPIKDGDAKFAEDEKKYPHLQGTVYLNAKTTTKPKVFDAKVEEILDPTEVTSGDYAKVSLNFKAFDKAGNKGVGVYLNAVQMLRKGPVVIGGGNAKDDFHAENDDVF
jgi:hypothetical protein